MNSPGQIGKMDRFRRWLYRGPLPRTIGIAFHNFLGAFLIAWFLSDVTNKETGKFEPSLIIGTWATAGVCIYVFVAYLYLRGLHQYENDIEHWKKTEKSLLEKLEPAMEDVLAKRIAAGEIKSLQELRKELQA